MHRARHFLRRRPQAYILFLRAWILLITIRIGLNFLPFRWMRRILDHFTRLASAASLAGSRPPAQSIIGAVRSASRYAHPHFRTCLVQALAAQIMLARAGYPSELKIGVARNSDNRLDAHAWLTDRENVLIGYLNDLHRFVPLPSIDRLPG
jgi:hypothetical protein